MKHGLLIFFSTLWFLALGQTSIDKKFSRIQLEEDLQFIQKELFDAHANPFTELDSSAYTNLFARVRGELRDSMTKIEFASVAKPLFSPLSDEHANLGVSLDETTLKEAKVFLPFTISMRGDAVVVDKIFRDNTNLNIGDTLTAIDGKPIREIIERCSAYTTGFPEQRRVKAVNQLGWAYVFAFPNKSVYNINLKGRQVRIEGVNFQFWDDYLKKSRGQGDCPELISYQKAGKTGYLNYCSFSIRSDSAYHQLELKIDAIFTQIKKEKIDTLIVDVSNNSGGNSQCGDLIINYLYSKSYKGYQCKWKRSDEYVALIHQWKSENKAYENMPAGSVISYGPSENTPSRRLRNRFKGKKVYVVVGPNTFSSAIMFATIVKDNHIATLIGQTPTDGHPNHFGEMYNSTTPNTRLFLRFGVKEWIRPSGERKDNVLTPDIPVNLDKNTSVQTLMQRISGH